MTGVLHSSAILSVSDKTGLETIAGALRDRGISLFSTSGTAAYLRGHGIEAREIADLTGQQPMLDGRIKALHPAIFAGLMARDGDADEMAARGYGGIGYLIAGVTPRAAGADDLSAIDIGGPAMIRAAAKNHERVVMATHPEDYDAIIAGLANAGNIDGALRKRLAHRAMQRLLVYDADALLHLQGAEACHPLPQVHHSISLRYGENPHQTGTLHLTSPGTTGAAGGKRLQGNAPSFTNILDADAAAELVSRFEHPAAVIVKHGAPCGVALGATPQEAYRRALATDPQSAFGGTVGLNRPVDRAAMGEIVARFTAIIVAPDFSPEARAIAANRPAMTLLQVNNDGAPSEEMDIRSVRGGILVQTRDRLPLERANLRCVTIRQPSEPEIDDMLFALEVSRFVKSNAAVAARGGATIGIGNGQSSRVGAVAQAVRCCASQAAEGMFVLASDAYFPFADSVEVAAGAGISAIVQQGGAKRDAEVIATADRLGLAMLFSDIRLFRH